MGDDEIKLDAAIAHFKELVKIMLYTKVFINVNIWITLKMFFSTNIYMLYMRDYVKSGVSLYLYPILYDSKFYLI